MKQWNWNWTSRVFICPPTSWNELISCWLVLYNVDCDVPIGASFIGWLIESGNTSVRLRFRSCYGFNQQRIGFNRWVWAVTWPELPVMVRRREIFPLSLDLPWNKWSNGKRILQESRKIPQKCWKMARHFSSWVGFERKAENIRVKTTKKAAILGHLESLNKWKSTKSLLFLTEPLRSRIETFPSAPFN